jgi:iron complex outermembrane receptor protein
MRPITIVCLSGAAIAAVSGANAQQASGGTLDPVVISVERSRQTTFDAPAAISAVTREVIDSGGPQVNLSEVLNRVPGIAILNRQNYAQDLQLSIRGFGSRSTFGIRGVRLIVDGIPATMPDGQGQASSIALGSAARIEVLRGPMAQLYGNAAGGVVQVVTEADAREPTTTASLALGAYDQAKIGVKFAAGGERDAVVLDASHYSTNGYREHGEARRLQLNGKWQREVAPGTRLSVVINALDQPESKDPAGLTRALWEADPHQVVPIVKSQNAGKIVAQRQIGAVLEHAIAPQTTLGARVYFGQRELDNTLSVSPAAPAQTSPTGAGGIVQFERGYSGVGLTIAHVLPLEGARAARLTAGVEADTMAEDRRGYLNTGGVQGALKRSEHNRVTNTDVFAQGSVDLAAAWTATAGVRASRVAFDTTDYFITPTNPDDSGSLAYRATNPVLGLVWRASPDLNVYANAGRGFETPTFTELAYRPTGSGLNTDLRASRSRHAEIGAKWRLSATQRLDAAVYDISTRDEIVVDTNTGGRSTFKNVDGRTTRRGVELQYVARYGEDWRATLSLAAMRARFADGFTSGSGASAVPVVAGNRLPGTPERSAFAELAWTPAKAWGGFNAAVELVHQGKLYVNDVNEDAAPAATVVNLRAGLRQSAGAWTFTQLLRVDNAADKHYAGSVIVNEANKRFFEPALPRNWMVGVTAVHTLR